MYALAYLLGLILEQQAIYGSPAQPTCVLERGAFCILDAGMEVQEGRVNDEERIIIYASHSPRQAAMLTFATGCLTLSSESPRLVGYSPYTPSEGRIYLKLVFQVADDCVLTVLAPSNHDADRDLLGLSIMLPIVRLCQERPCAGVRLLDVVPRRLRSHWFSPRRASQPTTEWPGPSGPAPAREDLQGQSQPDPSAPEDNGGSGRAHFNTQTGQRVRTPYVQGPHIPGGVRPAQPQDVPRRCRPPTCPPL